MARRHEGRGSGYGGGFGFDHELSDGWTPFGRFAFGTRTGTAIKDEYGIGLAQVHPFGRRGDMFGAVFNYIEPNVPAKHHESVFESFYRLRLTQSVELGPDIEVSIHPTYSAKLTQRLSSAQECELSSENLLEYAQLCDGTGSFHLWQFVTWAVGIYGWDSLSEWDNGFTYERRRGGNQRRSFRWQPNE